MPNLKFSNLRRWLSQTDCKPLTETFQFASENKQRAQTLKGVQISKRKNNTTQTAPTIDGCISLMLIQTHFFDAIVL
jgi:hypothetical protein